jgi:hypothetical protein
MKGTKVRVTKPGWHSPVLLERVPSSSSNRTNYFFLAADFFAGFLAAAFAAGFFLVGTDSHLRSMLGFVVRTEF